MSYLNSDKNNVSLEWAAMLVGVVVIFVTAYVIFGTEWNVYRVVNVLLGVAFIVFITYAYTNASNLKKALKGFESDALAMSKENESLRSAIGDIELTLEKIKNDNSRLESEKEKLEEEIDILKDKLTALTDPQEEEESKEEA